MKEVVPHLEALRTAIEESRFRVRAIQERRTAPRGPDRRGTNQKRATRRASRPYRTAAQICELSVTVSIGVAEPNAKAQEIEHVIQAADKALYRAKQAGRNRVEAATPSRSRASRLKRGVA